MTLIFEVAIYLPGFLFCNLYIEYIEYEQQKTWRGLLKMLKNFSNLLRRDLTLVADFEHFSSSFETTCIELVLKNLA